MSSLEIVAALFGAVSVWLSARQHIASWPTAIVNVLLSAVVYYETRLYADAGLQLVYAALSVYGWYEWKYGGADRSELPVSRTPRRLVPRLALLVVATALVVGYVSARYTDAAVPWLDASLTAVSLCAQWMMTRKLLGNWTLWIAVDLVYVPLLASKGLWAFAALYVVFLGLAAQGHVQWRRALRAREAAMAQAAMTRPAPA
ncbi:MAG TPA: nicotinamide riboside transporter PnuC [Gemmatirosa sp.]|nr:nicotinamide riboside transporter PnuC [Gemmatirosa sp.]